MRSLPDPNEYKELPAPTVGEKLRQKRLGGKLLVVFSLVFLIALVFNFNRKILNFWFSQTQKKIDLTFRETKKNDPYVFENNNLLTRGFKISLAEKSSIQTPSAKFETKDAWIKFRQASPSKTDSYTKDKTNKTVFWENSMQNIDMVYKVTDFGLKEDIILKNAETVNKNQEYFTIPFTIDTFNVIPKKDVFGQTTTAFVSVLDGAYRFHIDKPYAVDAAGERLDLLKFNLENLNASNSSSILNNVTKYTAILQIPSGWLLDPKRVYPVTIDPTVTHNTTALFAATGSIYNRLVDEGSGSSPLLTTTYHELPTDINTKLLWHLNEASGNATDSSGNSLTGTPNGTTVVAGRFGNARSFSVASNDAITFSNTNVGTNYTIESWINFPIAASANWRTLFANNGGTYHYAIVQNGASLLGVYNNAWYSCGFDVSTVTSGWHHFAFTVKAGETFTQFYLDGLPICQSATQITNQNFGIVGNCSTTCAQGAGTTIDEVRFSNIARTKEEIKQNAQRFPYAIFTSPTMDLNLAQSWTNLSWTAKGVSTTNGETPASSTNLVAQWNLNETSGTTAASGGSCGASCNGTLSNFASTASQDQAPTTGWTSANKRWGAGALMFDDTDDTVTGTMTDISGNYTLSAWVKMSNTGAAYFVSLTNYVRISQYNSGKFDCANNNGAGWSSLSSNMTLPVGEWHHIACTYDGTNRKIYYDGILKNSDTFAESITVNSFRLGWPDNSAAIGGALDAIQIYSRALTASEIIANYNAASIEFQSRTSADGSTWEAWKPTTNETQVEDFENNEEATKVYDFGLNNIAHNQTWIKKNNNIPKISDTTGTDGRIPLGSNGKGDDVRTGYVNVIKDASTYKMWYSGYDGANWRIFYATSSDGLTWTKYDNSILAASNTTGTNGRIPLGSTGGDTSHVIYPMVIKDGSTYKMWYSGYNGSNWRIFYATSSDGLTWTKSNNAVPNNCDSGASCSDGGGRIGLGSSGKGDDAGVLSGTVIKDGSVYKIWYSGFKTAELGWAIYYATSSDGVTWTKYENALPSDSDLTGTSGRVPRGTSGRGDDIEVVSPSVIKDGGIYKMWYRGHNNSTYPYQIFYATSYDGITWMKHDNSNPYLGDFIGSYFNTKGRITYTASMGDSNYGVTSINVLKDGNIYKTWYAGQTNTADDRIYYAEMNPMAGSQNTETSIVAQGSASEKFSLGQPQLDTRTVGLWRFEETSGTGAYLKNSAYTKTPFGPEDISGISLWVSADKITGLTNGQAVSSWIDVSGNGSNLTQATGSKQPTYQTNVLNGLPVVRFAAASAQAITNSVNYPTPVTVFYVGKQTGGANQRVLNATSNNWLLGYWGGAKQQAYFEGWVSASGTPATDTNWHVYSSVETGSLSTVYEDGTQFASNGNGLAGPNGIAIGCSQGGAGECSNADVAEVIVYNSALSTHDRKRVENYLFKKYALSAETKMDGTPSGTSVIDGFFGKARSFNGSSDSISASDIYLPTGGSTPFTVSAWVKTSTSYSTGNYGFITEWGTETTGQAFNLGIGTDANIGTNTCFAGFWGSAVGSVTAINDGKWHHCAAAYDGGKIVRIYLDGNYVNAKLMTVTPNLTKTGTMYIGRGSGGYYWNGGIDELKITPIYLTSEQIYEEYRAGLDQKITRIISSTDFSGKTKLPFQIASDRPGTFLQATIGESAFANYEPDANTMGLWHLDEGRIEEWRDPFRSATLDTQKWIEIDANTKVSQNNGLVMSAGSTAAWDSGVISKQTFGNTANSWVYFNVTTGSSLNYMMVGFGQDQITNASYSTISHALYFANGTLQVYQDGTLIGTYGSGYSTSTNYDVLITINSGGTAKYEIKGGAYTDWTTLLAADNAKTNATFRAQVANYQTSATISTIRVWNPMTKDSGSYGNDAAVAGTSLVQGMVGKGMNFNGTSNTVSILSSDSLNMGASQDFTVDAWVKTSQACSNNNYPTIYAKDDEGASRMAYGVVSSNGWSSCAGPNWFGYIYTNGTQYTVASPLSIIDGLWHHVAFVRSGSTLILYQDGTKVASTNAVTSTTTSTANAHIGSLNGKGYYFNGLIDEVRVSNSARSADDIRQVFEIGKRTHPITFDFVSSPYGTYSGGTSITINNPYGTTNLTDTLKVGDVIIIKRNENGTEYISQSTVSAITNTSTTYGTVTLSSAFSSIPPTSGYTTDSKIFKWQREYFDLTGSLSTHRDATTRLTFRVADMSQGANVWLDDVKSNTNYLNDNAADSFDTSTGIGTYSNSSLSSTANRYFQYRAIFSSTDPAVSSQLVSVSVNYTGSLKPNTPSSIFPLNSETNVATKPIISLKTTDTEGNPLKYKFQVATDTGFTQNLQTIDQTVSQTNWTGQNATISQANDAYTSNSWATYTFSSALSRSTLYYLRAYAIDPSGSNLWSDASSTISFTTGTDCAANPGGNVTITQSCSFPRVNDGVDTGTTTTNSAIITVDGASTVLTVNNGQTITAGTINLTNGGKITITNGGTIKYGQPIWVQDSTVRYYPDNATSLISPNNQSAPYVRRNTEKSLYGLQ